MADQKITELTEDTSIALTDLIPTVEDPSGTPVTKKTTVNTLATAVARTSMYRQALINGNFDVWERLTTSTDPANNAHVADHWRIQFGVDGGSNPTIIHRRQAMTSGDVDGSLFQYNINVNGAGSSYGANANYFLMQRIENGTRYLCGASKPVTISFYAYSNISGKKIGVYLTQNYGTGGAPTGAEDITGTYVTLSAGWVKYTVTITTNTLVGKTFGTDYNDYLQINFLLMWGTTVGAKVGSSGVAESFVGSGDIDFTQMQVCSGSLALPFQPKPYAEELLLCQRYCWVINSLTDSFIGNGLAASTTTTYVLLIPPVPMRSQAPDLTATAADWKVYDGNTATDVTSLTVIGATYSSRTSIALNASVASGLTQFRPYLLIADSGGSRILILDCEI